MRLYREMTASEDRSCFRYSSGRRRNQRQLFGTLSLLESYYSNADLRKIVIKKEQNMGEGHKPYKSDTIPYWYSFSKFMVKLN